LTSILTDAVRAAAALRLRNGVHDLGIDLTVNQESQLLDYLELLHKWGATFNLTAVLDPLEMVTLHLLDSLAVVPLVKRYGGGRVVDIGSGAGLPGIPLAIANPDLEVTLVDSVQKKTAFQTQVKGTLKLDNCTPLNGRMQALTFDKRQDLAVCRAFSSLEETARLAASCLTPDGLVIAMKGAVPTDEIAALDATWKTVAVEPILVPGLKAWRCAVVMQLSLTAKLEKIAGAHA
jgi:16S rRNA (guanine527-N7)-methyltransferase